MNTTTNARAYVAIFIGVLTAPPYIPLRGIPNDRAVDQCAGSSPSTETSQHRPVACREGTHLLIVSRPGGS